MLPFQVQWETLALITPVSQRPGESLEESEQKRRVQTGGFRERWSQGNEYRLWGKLATWPHDENHRVKLYRAAQSGLPFFTPVTRPALYTHFCGPSLSSLCPLIHKTRCNVDVRSPSHENKRNTAERKIRSRGWTQRTQRTQSTQSLQTDILLCALRPRAETLVGPIFRLLEEDVCDKQAQTFTAQSNCYLFGSGEKCFLPQ